MKSGTCVVGLAGWAKFRTSEFFAVGAVAASLGCSDLASGSDRLQDPLGKVPGWECLEDEPPTLPTPNPTPQFVAYVAPIFDFANPPNVVPGLSVSVCQLMDTECPPGKEAGQVMGPTSFMTTLQGAAVTVPLYTIIMPYGINAYLRMTAPGYLRQEYYFGGPLLGSPSGEVMQLPNGATAAIIQGLPFTPVKDSDADALASLIGLDRREDQAIIAVRTVGCTGVPSKGVTLSLDRAEGVPFAYLSGFALASTDPPQPTDENGLAGFANIELPNGVPLYNVTIEGVNPNGDKFGLRPFTVRPNQLTTGEVRPFPTAYGR